MIDSFMAHHPAQSPPSLADSCMTKSPNADNLESPQSVEQRLPGKRKQNVGENTRFLVTGLTNGMRESMETLGGVMRDCEQLHIAAEEKKSEHMAANCDL
ncbi:hypothetical protein R1flu_001641 [Riccia fluitans]|uniref:Uncharacterized protein n=1 Tax=Riccia fluitans TaxID=41844 RepID=A0ABD1Y467_9MARC